MHSSTKVYSRFSEHFDFWWAHTFIRPGWFVELLHRIYLSTNILRSPSLCIHIYVDFFYSCLLFLLYSWTLYRLNMFNWTLMMWGKHLQSKNHVYLCILHIIFLDARPGAHLYLPFFPSFILFGFGRLKVSRSVILLAQSSYGIRPSVRANWMLDLSDWQAFLLINGL